MSHKYSNTGSRRKSVFTPNINNTNLNEASAQTIELERLEQEITLTLQTIDKAFAKSHKIINDRLIPIVKKYHNSSKKIWQGVSFWKNFLETSANVELRGYEEAVQNQDYTEDDQIPESQEQGSQETQTGDTVQLNEHLSPVKTAGDTGNVIMESTNHTIQQEFQKRYTDHFQDDTNPNDQDTTSAAFKSSTPNKLKNNPIMPQVRSQNNLGFDTTDSILPPIPVSANLSNTNGTDVNQTTPTLQRSNTDIQQPRNYILHNNLDTNYKLEVSPRKKHPHQPAVNSMTPKKPPQKKRKSIYAQKYDSSPFEIEAPKLQSDVQFSPVRPNGQTTPLRKQQTQASQQQQDENQTQRFPHTPRYGAGGNLLRTPGQVSRTANRYSNHGFQQEEDQQINQTNLQLDDSNQTPNISPPVTLNFATVKNNNNTTTQNLRRTPAREAAQNIVKDILNNVSGVNDSGLSGFEEFNGNKIRHFDDTDNQDSLFNENTEKPVQQQQQQPTESEVLGGQEFDDFLDNKYRETNKNAETDWSDDD
ncbi:unnamed protein product [Wickerhamomyces anomalus]